MSGIERLYSPPEIGAPGKRSAKARHRDLTFAGLFVLGMVALAVVMFAVLMPALFGDVYRLRAYFDEASGLNRGTQVVQEGYVIGFVENVTPIFPGSDEAAQHCLPVHSAPEEAQGQSPCFRADMRIRHGWPIPLDSRVLLGSAGLLQGKVIKIQPGAGADRMEDGQVFAAADQESDLGGQLEALTQSLTDLVDQTIEPALVSIRGQIETIEGLIGTSGERAENKERLAGAFQNLQQLSEKLESAVDPQKFQEILSSVEQLTANLASVSATLTERSGEIERTVESYGDLATDIRGMVKTSKPSLQRSIDDAQFLLQELSAALVPILTNIEDATRNLSALSRDLRADPAVILKGREVKEKTPWLE